MQFAILSRDVSFFVPRYSIPWQEIKPKSRVLLYGYGVVGRYFFRRIRKTNYCNIIAISDKKAYEIARSTDLSVSIVTPERICEFIYDYVLLAVKEKKLADEIMNELMLLGIDINKIKWIDPFSGQSSIEDN